MRLLPRSVFAAAACAVTLQAAPAATWPSPASDGHPFDAPNLAAPRPAQPLAAGPLPQSGHVVITEIMKDPAHVTDARGEWFEVWNAMPWRVNLEGWTISDESGASHVISTGGSGLRLGPGQFAVIGNNSDPALNGGIQVDYVWSSFSLGNGADQILLTRPDGTLADRVAYDDGVLWPDAPGRSLSLRPGAWDVLSNDDPLNWCAASSPISATNPDRATPGRDNDVCP
ncbi:MAG: lamin tail domain-containing protein [Planctomycetes bacterium]|nr:lamin tail domain-containing protein [Planctomycetota bacterium]